MIGKSFFSLRFHCSLPWDKHFTRMAMSKETWKLRQGLLLFHFPQTNGHKSHTIRELFPTQSLISLSLYKIIYLYIGPQLPLVSPQNSLSPVSPQSVLSTTSSINNVLFQLFLKLVWQNSKKSIISYSSNRNNSVSAFSLPVAGLSLMKNQPYLDSSFLRCNLLESTTLSNCLKQQVTGP